MNMCKHPLRIIWDNNSTGYLHASSSTQALRVWSVFSRLFPTKNDANKRARLCLKCHASVTTSSRFVISLGCRGQNEGHLVWNVLAYHRCRPLVDWLHHFQISIYIDTSTSIIWVYSFMKLKVSVRISSWSGAWQLRWEACRTSTMILVRFSAKPVDPGERISLHGHKAYICIRFHRYECLHRIPSNPCNPSNPCSFPVSCISPPLSWLMGLRCDHGQSSLPSLLQTCRQPFFIFYW